MFLGSVVVLMYKLINRAGYRCEGLPWVISILDLCCYYFGGLLAVCLRQVTLSFSKVIWKPSWIPCLLHPSVQFNAIILSVEVLLIFMGLIIMLWPIGSCLILRQIKLFNHNFPEFWTSMISAPLGSPKFSLSLYIYFQLLIYSLFT